MFAIIGKEIKLRIACAVFLGLVATLSGVVFSGAVAYSFKLAYADRSSSFSSYALPLGVGITDLLLAFISSLLKDRVSLNLSSKLRTSLREKIFQKALSLGSFKSRVAPRSSLTTVAMEGVEDLDSFYSGFLPNLFHALILPWILLAACLSLDAFVPEANPLAWVYGWTMFGLIPLIPFFIGLMSMSIGRVFSKYWVIYLRMGGKFADVLRGVSVLKDFSTARRKAQELDGENEAFRKVTMKVLTTELVSLTLLDLLSYGGVASGMAVALYFGTAAQNPTAWAVCLFLILIAFQFFLPMRTVASLAMVAGRGVMALKRIRSFLLLPDPKFGKESPEKWDLKVQDLSFRYPDEKDQQALSNLSLSLPEKGFYGIVGASGSGKSTFSLLLTGGLEDEAGSVRYGGIPLTSIDRDRFYSHVALIQGFSPIPSGSIRDLFQFYRPGVDDACIEERLRSYGLSELLDNSEGLDYRIEENSKNVSVGERQRLLLAATLSSHRDVWIFDEVSSALDEESMKIIDERIHDLAKDSLVLMISHHIAETEDAREIFVFDQGRIVQRGTGEDLRGEEGPYRSLWMSQREGRRA